MTPHQFHHRRSQTGAAMLQIQHFASTGSLPEETSSSRGPNKSAEKFPVWVRDSEQRGVYFLRRLKGKHSIALFIHAGGSEGKAELSGFPMRPDCAAFKGEDSKRHLAPAHDGHAEESMGGSASNKMNNDAHESDLSCVLIRRAHVSA